MSFGNSPVGEPEEVTDPNLALAANESGYLAPDVEADQTAISQQVFADLAGRVPGWQPHDGNLDTWMVESFSEVGAEIRSLAADVPASIFTTYGDRILQVPPQLATAATGIATVTAADAQGYTLDAGTTFGLPRSGNDMVAFQTLQEATIPVGELEVANVPFAAVETGANGNSLSGAGQMLDPVTWVASVVVPIATATGQDAETPDAYVNRLANLFPAVGLRPILPIDFAILALQLIPGVGRGVAMNLYDPVTDTWTNERTVTLLVAQADGTPCSIEVKSQVETMLEGLREINWVLHVIDPHYAPVDVTFDVVAFSGQDQASVHENCVANVTSYLQPATYRLGEMSPAIAGGEVIFPPEQTGTSPRRQTIYVNELVSLLDRTLGVDRVVSVLINGAPADYTLPDHYTLPQPGAVSGTVAGTGGVYPPRTYRDVIMTDRPVAYYRLGEAGGLAADECGGADGTFAGAYVRELPSLLPGGEGHCSSFDPDAAGLFGMACVTVPDSPATRITGPTTFECWFEITGLRGDGHSAQYAFSDAQSSMAPVLRLYLNASATTTPPSITNVVAYNSSGANIQAGTSNPLLPLDFNTPHHIAHTCDVDAERLILDGAILIEGAGAPPGNVNATGFVIGRTTSTTTGVVGKLQEVAVYDYALTPEQVLAHYQAGL